ncbi:MAG TPA: DNA mismatch repair endonuclease MutL [Ktedonobacterales bacterium]|nr:DNA mismatch repair endonuclease MutL [Ktedonobacterales bacterium]
MSSARIQPLPPEVVERIAAGEVIERPASVVRELLDNALDAGATSVRVELRDGGCRLIRVADDGAGIPPDELPLACQPHTTSKIATLGDLGAVATLGFRGEALASIAAVAAFELSSAASDDGLAHTIALLPGKPQERTVAARSRGTTATVHDLFQSIPARRALLRGPRAEAQRALGVVRAYALARPDVNFTLVLDGQLALQTPGGSVDEAVAAIYGADLSRRALPLGVVTADSAVLGGVVGPRGVTFTTREHVVLAVNGRVVANRALLTAAATGYGPLLRKGRHPLLVATLSLPPAAVDANIHPAKAEVLLADEPEIARLLREAVHAALGRAAESVAAHSSPPTAPHFTRPLQLALPAPRTRRGLLLGERRRRYHAAPAPLAETLPSGPLSLAALCQFDDALILARTPAGDLYLVDQHRAHERVLYERLSASREGVHRTPLHGGSAQIPGQYLLDPVLVELTPRQAAILTPRLEELASLGIDCQPFGGSVFLVRALPALATAGPVETPHDVAGALTREAAEDADDWLEHVRIALACRTAIKRGQTLAPSEQRALLADLCGAAVPAICPHGSPILLRYSREYLTHAFEW